LAPIGIAMLGYRIGDTFEWKVPAGLRRLEVRGILYQPEAAGKNGLDHDLACLSQAQWADMIEKLFTL
jgi:hypothetical protein